MRALTQCHWCIVIILLSLELTCCLSSSIQVPENRTKINSRRKRFVRFPVSSPGGYLYENTGPSPNARNIYLPSSSSSRFSPVWRQQKSFRWSPPGPPTGPSVPIMAHRTPRLIFRDDYPTLPASGIGNSFFQSNQLSLDTEEDSRGFYFHFFYK